MSDKMYLDCNVTDISYIGGKNYYNARIDGLPVRLWMDDTTANHLHKWADTQKMRLWLRPNVEMKGFLQVVAFQVPDGRRHKADLGKNFTFGYFLIVPLGIGIMVWFFAWILAFFASLVGGLEVFTGAEGWTMGVAIAAWALVFVAQGLDLISARSFSSWPAGDVRRVVQYS